MLRPTRHVPERTCLGCRRRAPKGALVRFVAVPRGGERVLMRDPDGALGGRGLYTCDAGACFMAAVERRGFARGARGAVVIDEALAQGLGDAQAVRGA
ncbi:MAG: YlxR family protein [Thermoleophilia bacterium]